MSELGPGRGGLQPAPQNAPPPGSVSPGIQAGTSTPVVRATQLIIYGTGETGLFEYSGTPALGNPPEAYAAPNGVTKDPYGNTLPQSGGGFTSVASPAWSALIGGGIQFALTAINAIQASIGEAGSPGGYVQMQINSGTGTEAGATASELQVNDSGYPSSSVLVVSGLDGNTYDVERLSMVAAGQNFITAAPAAITGLSCNVAARQYRIVGMLRCKQTSAVVADILGFNGGTATITAAEIQADNYEVGSSQEIFGNILNTLTTVNSNAYGIGDNYRWIIWGTITFATAGTFIMTGACTANGDDWGIAALSGIDLLPIG
jgi:hypothetical protein